ncbi:hypothetical protein VST7929_01144 [Vibrio stylophorae]|uniref:Lipoprotein n=1 Tax=Vibrio stylophorae TaxID=659351 RepID=A0ABM8ZSK1_9VIBR|nr:type II secretion system pilot lipoprotein GspS-beta [Vibrio stylophorae]CAH0533280.1 hypothetical protein VST7929_01144 [Vibrio stylophorae]
MFRTLSIALLSSLFLLSGCASQEPESHVLARYRADVTIKKLPQELPGYRLINVKAKENRVRYVFLRTDSKANAQRFSQNISKGFCQSEELKSLLDQGVVYEIEIRDANTKIVADKLVTLQDCPVAAKS